MPSVDNRVVNMEFNTATFERRLDSTMKGLADLEKALKMDGAVKGLADVGSAADKLYGNVGKLNGAFKLTDAQKSLSDTAKATDDLGKHAADLPKSFKMDSAIKNLADVGQAADRISFSHITGGISDVSKSFVALSTIAISALATITNHAVTAGLAMSQSFSFGPILDGFHEYETQLNSVQTILANTASKGETLETVNAALQQLNEYADKTIYNFSEMARNIGTFTAAGVGLQTSVNAIKGIANLAALSGSSAQQASSAMYQLSQAIATGTLRLIDWNSVNSAGIGGENFKKTLFETGKALKTLKDVPIDQTFEEWEKANGNFRESLEKDWVTADVLTTALATYTGDIKDADLAAKGFNQRQIDMIHQNATLASQAAQDVKTFTQLIGTVREAIGTGWADTFRIVIGNFTEAKSLWTQVYNSINDVLTRTANMRNMILTGWKQGGGALLLFDGIRRAIVAIGKVIKPIHDAFREFFPRQTAQNLIDISKAFNDFTKRLTPSKALIDGVRNAARILFSTLAIGWEILKGGAKFIASIVGALATLGGNLAGGPLKSFADFMASLSAKGVDKEGIKKFFDELTDKVLKLIPTIREIKSWVDRFFGIFKSPIVKTIEGILERIGGGFKSVGGAIRGAQVDAGAFLSPLWESVQNAQKKLDKAFEAIKDWFHRLGEKIAKEIGKADWSAVTASLDTALLGILTGVIVKFFKGAEKGKLDLTIDPTGGLFKQVKESFDQLTNVLVDMQTRVKAEALEKIAIAVGILAAAVIALSFVDPAKLTAALTAMGAAFGQMIAAFYVLNNLNSSPFSAAQFAVIAAGFNVLASSMVVFALAIAALGTMDIDTIAKGLLAFTVILGEMLVFANLLSTSGPQLIAAGIAMNAFGVGLNIVALAVRQFGSMDVGELAKGLAGITLAIVGIGLAVRTLPNDLIIQGPALIALAAALNLIALAVKQLGGMDLGQMLQGLGGITAALIGIGVAMKLMPLDMPIMAAGLVVLGAALNIIALAVKQFADMDFGTMLKGLGGVTLALTGIGLAMGLMPLSLPLTAAGLLGVAISLNIMAKAIQAMGQMSWSEIGKGMVVLGGSLLILAVGLSAMSEAAGGAVALGIAAVSLGLFINVLKAIVAIKMGDLAAGLGKMALALGAIAAVSLLLAPAIPAILGLGIALSVLGGAFFLFGAGIGLVAKGFSILAKTGEEGSKNLVKAMKNVGAALPAFFDGLAKATLGAIETLGKGLAMFAGLVVMFIGKLLDGVIVLMPKMYVIMYKLFKGLISLGYTFGGPMIQLGIFLLVQLLEGIRNNIEHITEVVGDIIIGFLTAMKVKMPGIIAAGTDLLVTFLDGIAQGIPQIAAAIDRVILAILLSLAGHAIEMVGAGVTIIIQVVQGIVSNLVRLFDAGGQMIGELIRAFGAQTGPILQAAVDVVVNFLKGIASTIGMVIDAGVDIIVAIIDGIDRSLQRIVEAGTRLIVNFIKGVDDSLQQIIDAGKNLIIHLIQGIADAGQQIIDAAGQAIIKFMNGIADSIRSNSEGFREAGKNIASAIISGVTGGLSDKAGDVIGAAKGLGQKAVDGFKEVFHINSPSLVMRNIGHGVGEGLVLGINQSTAPVVTAAEQIVAEALEAFGDMSKVADTLDAMDEFNPVITPVLDLSRVEAGATDISKYIERSQKLAPSVSYGQAQAIAAATKTSGESVEAPAAVDQRPLFEQTINAPHPLSATDIYKQTRNLITFAKEDLNIP